VLIRTSCSIDSSIYSRSSFIRTSFEAQEHRPFTLAYTLIRPFTGQGIAARTHITLKLDRCCEIYQPKLAEVAASRTKPWEQAMKLYRREHKFQPTAFQAFAGSWYSCHHIAIAIYCPSMGITAFGTSLSFHPRSSPHTKDLAQKKHNYLWKCVSIRVCN
jgi:hypothetical protein